MAQQRFFYAYASEQELNDLANGRAAGAARSWPFRGVSLRQSPGSVGVLWKESPADAPIRPLALIVETSEQKRLFARFAQVRSDLSPLSSWCHILSPSLFASLDEPIREPNLGGFEASWAGLVIAEAAVLSDRAVSQLKLAACFATQTYAVARTLAIWPGVSINEVRNQYGALQRDIRQGAISDLDRINFAPLWTALASLSLGYGFATGPYEHVANAAMSLKQAREMGDDEVFILMRAFGHLPEAAFLSKLTNSSPEDRLKTFDDLVKLIREDRSNSLQRVELTFLAGYLATVAAGGAASLSLANNVAQSVPEIMGWAYLIGGLGERVTWSGGFSGLGRLVARELMRPFRIDDPPAADFAADEARVLIDKQLSDPLVHLQLKQSRVATAALFPGVNLQVPFSEQTPEPNRQQDNSRSSRTVTSSRASSAEASLQAIVNALAPLLLDQMRDQLTATSRERGTKTKWSKGPQRKLPLADDE